MDIMESLNHKYVGLKKVAQALSSYGIRIGKEVSNSQNDSQEKFFRVMMHVDELIKTIDCTKFASLSDTITLGLLYRRCAEAIADYQSALLEISNGKARSGSISKSLNALKNARAAFAASNASYFAKHAVSIDSFESMCAAIKSSIYSEETSLQKALSSLQQEAKEILSQEQTTELSLGRAAVMPKALPSEMLVARFAISETPYDILRDIGIHSTYQNVFSELRNQGNVIVNTRFEQMADEALDEFVVAYIFRFVEAFPLGAANVHIFDKNASYLYKRLSNHFQKGDSGSSAKRVVQLHSAIADIATFQSVVCEDIFKKTSVSSPDLYSVYEYDQTDAFNLIVLRNGLVDNNGFVSTEIIDAIKTLSKSTDIGHRCGIRFLIIDDSQSFEKNLNANAKFSINAIKQNCAVQFEYKEGVYYLEGKPVEPLSVVGDVDTFVQNRAEAIASAVTRVEKSYISLDEVSDHAPLSVADAIIYIPVGKSGNEVIKLPFSCRDEKGTVAGQCIGYMAIGQSGSGKSAFFHSLVLGGCLRYSPKDLQFWLLDFKYGGASSKYSNSGIPHIRIIAENNKIDDALCLFQMILEEMERRNKAFQSNFTDNIVDYNKKAMTSSSLEYFPRIIIAIDEVQEIFRDDNAAVLQKLISSISVRMRSAGMHFVMVAQNLCEGKSYMLKEAFLPSATGRICFRVAPSIPRDSGFEDDFAQRKQEISELKTGEAYVSYGKDTIKKVKMAYASPDEMQGKYFEEIKNKYPAFSNMKPLVIGSKKRLAITDELQHSSSHYSDVIDSISPINGIFSAVIGEDAYRMEPLRINFSQHENSAVLLLGNDKEIASSLCTSIAVSLIRQDAMVYLFNGDKTRVQVGYQSVPHPFMHLCQVLPAPGIKASDYKLSEFSEIVKKLYSEYLKRQREVQDADDDVPDFQPLFLIINDLFGIESFVNNDLIQNDSLTENQVSANSVPAFSRLESRLAASTPTASGSFKENSQSIMSILVRNGYRYNIHVVLAIKGDPAIWRNSRIVSEVNNVVLFNPTQFADQISNTYYLKEMLKNISSENGEETMAVWASKKNFSKIRPIIYKMTTEEAKVVDSLVLGDVK